MIPPDHYIMFLKFSEQRWIDSLINGNFSFSCVGKFIQQAQETGDTVQGDCFEGYFARMKKDDKRLFIIRSKLKDDLEESDDGKYVLLRRKSALTVPIFCIYGYQCIDAVNEAPSSGKTKIRHNFDERLFDAFANKWDSTVVADDRRATYAIFQAKAFCDRIMEMREKEKKDMLKKEEWKGRLALTVFLQIEYSMILMSEKNFLLIRQTLIRNCCTNAASMHINMKQEFIFPIYIFCIFLIENQSRLALLINQSTKLNICQ